MSKVPISVCLIAKNEEKHIAECLKRIKPYGFEIIVTDTGSTDRTKELAAHYADKVLDFAWTDDFSAARNYCAAHASNPWILVLDCDEYVNSIDVARMRILMQKFPRFTGIIRLKNLILHPNGEQGYASDDITRFYNKNYYTFDYPIHEQICTKDVSARKNTMECFMLPMEVVHHGYALNKQEMENKQRRNLELLYRNLERNPNNSYILFQIGQSEFILGNHEKAVFFYEKGMEQNLHLEYIYVQIMIESLAKAYVKVGRAPEALALMERYSKTYKTAKFQYTYANVCLDNNQPLKALMYYVKTTMMKDADTLGENLLHCYEQIIALSRNMGNEEMACMFQNRRDAAFREKERVVNS